MQTGSEATVFLQRAESSWLRLNGSVRVSITRAENSGVAGFAIKLDPANQDVKVPKRVRELWIGVAAFVKCNQVNSKELRFALPVNNKGYMGCAVKFEEEKDLRKFQGFVSSFDIAIENALWKTEPSRDSTSSASRSLTATQGPTAGTSKKRSAADVTQQSDSQSSSPPEIFGGDRRKPRIERASQGCVGESDSEPETEPENDWDGKSANNRALSVDGVKGSEPASSAKVQSNTSLPVEELDLNDKKTQSYIQHLYKDENFRQFTKDLEELVRKEPRIPGGTSAADPIMGFIE